MGKKLTQNQKKLVEMIRARGGRMTLASLRREKLIDRWNIAAASANANRLAGMGVLKREPSAICGLKRSRSADVLTLLKPHG